MIGKSYIFHLFLFLLILPDSIYSQDNICLIPQVESMVRKKGTLSIERLESIHFPDEWKNTGNLLVSDLKELANLSVMVNASNPSIHVKKVKMQEPEMYMLEITKQGIIIEAGDQTGMIHAFSTLLQLILGSEGKELPRLIIHDKPRFSYRGVMIDCSRHFWTIEQLKKYTKQLAFFKLNTLHLHLTDNQGWRLYLDQYPDLAFKGTYYRTFEDLSGHYYRKSELQELINYAAMYGIEIIPEIDLPGHCLALLAALPQLSCKGGKFEAYPEELDGQKRKRADENMLCIGNPETYRFVEKLVAELTDLFPSSFIHLGGDEVSTHLWEQCPKCQKIYKQENMTSWHELQDYFTKRVSEIVRSKGKRMIGWDEINDRNAADISDVIMIWQRDGREQQQKALKRGLSVIMSPKDPCYFDFGYSRNSTRRLYEWEPVGKECTNTQAHLVKGGQANLWTEYIPTFSQVEYMELPRMAALADIQWTNPEHKDYQDFLQRLVRMVKIYDVYQYNYAKHVFDVTARFEPNAETGTVDVTLSTVDNCPVYYTLDGTDPTTASQLYTEPVKINTNCTFKAMAVRPTGNSRIVKEDIAFSKSTSKKITALQPVNKQYEFAGISTLVDGLKGNRNYKTGRWIAFYKNDMEAVIDFGQPADFSKVTLTTNVEKGDWIFDARSISVAVSEDGENFKQVASEEYPAMTLDNPNQLYEHVLSFEPVKARYLKVLAKPEYNIPSWHGGKGNPAFLFVDEITVD